MTGKHRNNPLALAVLVSLYERPMHPYEVASVLRERAKHESVRLNYGSLYGVVESLERRGLIEAQETARQGRRPERTVYELTAAGRVEMDDWLGELLSTPVKEYPQFEAALSFLPAIPPDEAARLLNERAQRLEIELAQGDALRTLMAKKGLPRLFWVEAEFRLHLAAAELTWVRALADDIVSGDLDGVGWWRDIHEHGLEPEWPPGGEPAST
jgi:DNA-binding PadR family transcriptional regulator